MSSLYEINTKWMDAKIRADIEAEENDGVIEDALSEMLDTLEMDREEKIENTALYIKNRKAEIKMIKEEEDNLKKRRKIVESDLSRTVEWLKFNLHGEKRTAGNFKISYRNSKATEISDIDLVPIEYKTIKTTEMADKTAIKKAILSGVEVAGACVIEKQNMEVK
jgi:hypothetical protein